MILLLEICSLTSVFSINLPIPIRIGRMFADNAQAVSCFESPISQTVFLLMGYEAEASAVKNGVWCWLIFEGVSVS